MQTRNFKVIFSQRYFSSTVLLEAFIIRWKTSLTAAYSIRGRDVSNQCFSHVVYQCHKLGPSLCLFVELLRVSEEKAIWGHSNWTLKAIRSDTLSVGLGTPRRIQPARGIFFRHSISSRNENGETSVDISELTLSSSIIAARRSIRRLSLGGSWRAYIIQSTATCAEI